MVCIGCESSSSLVQLRNAKDTLLDALEISSGVLVERGFEAWQ